MKKRILALTLALLTVMTVLAGCSKALYDYDSYEKYINLGKTEGIEVNQSDINDGITLEWRELFNEDDDGLTETTYSNTRLTALLEKKEKNEMTDAEKEELEKLLDISVEVGDVANIDYVGKKDDVAFDGGTASGYDLTIGSNSFIDGFEDGLIGYKVGDKLSLKLTFPKNYSNADLAGADVVFEVTVNSITRTTGYPEYNDENIAKKTDYKTVAEFEEAIKKETVQNLLWQELYADSKVISYPEKELKKYYYANIENVEDYATMFGMTLSSYVTTYQGYSDIKTFYQSMLSYAKQQVKQELIVLRFIEAHPEYAMDDEKYNAEVEKLYNEYVAEENYTGTLKKFKKQYDRMSLEITIYYDIVMDYLTEHYVTNDDITKNGFVTDRNGVRYYENNDYYTGWKTFDPDGDGTSSLYYFDANGYAPNNTTLVVKGHPDWEDKDAEMCAKFGENGLYIELYTGTDETDAGTRYYKDGVMQTGKIELDLDSSIEGNETYFFDTETGYMVKGGIAEVDGAYYNFSDKGVMGDKVTGIYTKDEKTSFFDKDGKRLTSSWVKYDAENNEATGVTFAYLEPNQNYYYCGNDGYMVTAVTKVSDIYFAFSESGVYQGSFTGTLEDGTEIENGLPKTSSEG